MKTIYNKIAGAAMLGVLAGSMASCMPESPFSADGEGVVRMNVSVNPAVTRAESVPSTPADEQELRDKCVIYISNSNGLLHKWRGVGNVPARLPMRYGSYTAEAWSGDSVSAAYESEGKKFYKGIQNFSVSADSPETTVVLNCTLANVVGSVEESTIDNRYVQDMKVTFSTTRGSLSFDSENWADKAYFMMSSKDKNNDEAGTSNLNYTVEGKDLKGNAFKKEGVIDHALPAHEYRLNFKYDPSAPTDGGAFISIVVDESWAVTEGSVDMLGRPSFMWQEEGMGIDDQIVGTRGEFSSCQLRVAAFGGFSSVRVSPVDNAMFDGLLPVVDEGNGSHEFEIGYIMDSSHSYSDDLNALGIEIGYTEVYDLQLTDVRLCKYTINFSDKWLNSLPESDVPYELNITATDVAGKSSEMLVSIANTKKAIRLSAPVNVDVDAMAQDFTAVRARSVTLPLTFDSEADLTGAAIQYRESGTASWTTQPIVISRADMYASVKVTGLKPSTEYEYRTVAGAVADGEYEMASKVATFTTESVFTIPNASMEEWGTYSAKTLLGTKNVTFPGAGDHAGSFWDSGNEGAATANKTLTDKSTDMLHSGTYSARLKSDQAMGIIAAGNIFTGRYVKTDGTNGELSFGQVYDGSHPDKIKVWANYRPGIVDIIKSGNEKYVPDGFKGQKDHGQIYVALTSAPVEVKTKDPENSLFRSDADYVIGYGEVTWTDDFGPENALQELEVSIKYNENAKTVKPTHLVIVCSASKYGDYFSGSSSSVMYVDDFELIYE